MLPIHIGDFHGEQHPDGVIGFDYRRQVWVDTRPTCERDYAFRPGSASNPLAKLDDAELVRQHPY